MRPRRFDRETYHGVGNNVERLFGWLESHRKIAARNERIPKLFLALTYLACISILWRELK